MKTDIYLNYKLYAARKWDGVPRAGDLIQLGIDLFVVEMVVWCDPDNEDLVNLFVIRYKPKT